jgi:hypothetical protein
MKAALFFLAIGAYLIWSLYPAPWLAWLISGTGLIIVMITFFDVKGIVRGLGAVFLCIGTGLHLFGGSAWPQMLQGFGNMLNILSLFAIIPLIALPIRLGRYAERVREMIASRVGDTGTLYAVSSSLSYVLSSFMNVATFPMMVHLIRPSLDLYPIRKKERFLSRAVIHGFAMPTLWTPVTPIVGIIVEMTGASWESILAWAVPLSLLGLAVDIAMGIGISRNRRKHWSGAASREVSATKESAGKEGGTAETGRPSHPAQILLAILAFNGLVFFLGRTTHFGFMLNVTLAVAPFAFCWSVLLRQGRTFLRLCKETLPMQVLKMKDQFFVFLSAGYMISALQASGFGHVLNEWIRGVMAAVGSDLFLLMIPLIPLGLAYVGFHPAVALALTAESLHPASLGISVETTAVAMLIGASTAFLMGPYNATIGIMSGLIGQSNYRISNWNAPFTAVYLLLGMIVLLIANG